MADPVPPGDSEALSRRVAELNAKFDAMSSATSSVKWTTRLVAAGVAVASIVGVTMLIMPIYRVYDEPKPLQDALDKEMAERLRPAVEKEVQEIMSKSGREFFHVARAEYEANQEKLLGSVSTEMDSFVKEMSEWGGKEFETRRDRIQASLVDRLKKEIPELQNEDEAELIMANAQRAMDNAVNRMLTTHLSDHITAVNNIGNNLQTFPVPQEIGAMTDLELREALTQALGSYALLALRGSLNEDTKTLLREVTKDPAGGETVTDTQ